MEMDKFHSKIQLNTCCHVQICYIQKEPVTSNHHNFPHALDLQETHRTPAQGLNIQLIAMPRSDSQSATKERGAHKHQQKSQTHK